MPDWEPHAEWPRDPELKTPLGKGVDCIKPTSAIKAQSEMIVAAGTATARAVPVKRIKLPKS